MKVSETGVRVREKIFSPLNLKPVAEAIGRSGGFLKQAYAVEKAKIEARKKGYSVIEKKTDTGIRLHVRLP